MKTRFAGFFLATIASLASISLSPAAPGELDPGFGGTGTARIGFGFGEDLGRAVAVQPDGKVVVAGSSGTAGFFGGNFSVVRYGTNDLLDDSFGDGGKVLTPILRPDLISQASAVQIQGDGKIVVAGRTQTDTSFIFALARYLPNGALDDSFGSGGIVTTGFETEAEANAMMLQADGKIIVAGAAFSSGRGGIVVARYGTNGVLDETFGGTGKVITDTGNPNTRASGVVLQADGKVVVTGTVSINIAVFRYTANGVLDATFGAAGTGKVITHLGGPDTFSGAGGVTMQSGNGTPQEPDKIIVAGHTEAARSKYVFAVLRYDLNGVLDPTFGNGGVATNRIGPGTGFGDFATAVLVQGTGLQSRRILVAGYTDVGGNDIFCLARFNASGVPDASFDGDGRVLTSFGPEDNRARAMALVPGGKLLVVGDNLTSEGNSDFALARYHLADGSADVTYDGDGLRLQDVASRTASAKAVAIQADGKILVVGNAENGVNYSVALARFQPAGGLDPSFGVGGRVIVPLGPASSDLNAVLLQPDGKIVAAGFTDTNFLVLRFTANGVLDPTFSGDGIALTGFGSDRAVANALASQSDGKIIAAGLANNGANDDFAVARYTTNGLPDATFDGDGKTTTAIEGGNDSAAAVKVQANGKIVVAGYGFVGTSVNFAVVQYNPNGVLDGNFGVFGRVATSFGTGASVGLAMVLQPDAKILVAGYTFVNGFDVALIRYTPAGVPDDSFDGDGKVSAPIGLGTDLATAVTLQTDGKILVGATGQIGAQAEFAALRFQSNGVLDATYGIGGRALVNFDDDASNQALGMAVDATGRVLLAGDAGGLFGVARLQADVLSRVVSVARLPNRHAVIAGIGAPNRNHLLQGATNLIPGNFQTVAPVTTDGAGNWQYEDANAVNLPARFYRLVSP